MAKIYLFNKKKEPLVLWNKLGIKQGVMSISTYLPTDMVCVSLLFKSIESKEYFIRQKYFIQDKSLIDSIDDNEDNKIYLNYLEEDSDIEVVDSGYEIYIAIIDWLNEVQEEMKTTIDYVNYDEWSKEIWNQVRKNLHLINGSEHYCEKLFSTATDNIHKEFLELFNKNLIVFDNPIILHHYDNYLQNKISRNRTGIFTILQNLTLLKDKDVKFYYPTKDWGTNNDYILKRNKEVINNGNV